MKSLFFAVLAIGVCVAYVQAQNGSSTKTDQPVELGSVKWIRDLDSAVASSKTENKPIAILFQEVPG